MADVSIISFGIVDMTGQRKTLPFFIPATATDVNISTFINDIAANLDAAIDGKIVDVSVTKTYALPGGLKAAAVVGNTVKEGALLSFDVENTSYRHSIYIPTWEQAGFSGNAVNNSGVYATLITDILNGPASGADIDPTDRQANDLVSFLGGVRTFRK